MLLQGQQRWSRIARSMLVLAGAACGPQAGGGYAEGEGTGATNTSNATSASTGEGATDTGSIACIASDLPAPFCHERLDLFSLADPIILPASPPEWRPIAFQSSSRGVPQVNLFDTKSMTVTATMAQRELNGTPALLHGDFDGDGASDIAVAALRDVIPTFRWPDLEPLGTVPSTLGLDGLPKRNFPAVGFDIDRDGKEEILAFTGSEFDVWKWDGEWSLLGQVATEYCNTWRTKHCDIDGDGVLELITHGYDCSFAESTYDPEWDVVQVFHSAHGAVTMTAQRFPMGLRSLNLVAGDYNGDGLDDIMAIGRWEQIALLLGQADGSLGEPTILSLGAPFYEVSEIASDLSYEDFARSGDFDGDGSEEVLLTIPTEVAASPTTMILIRFVDNELIPLDLRSSQSVIEAGDINHDQRSDIIAASSGDTFLYRSTLNP